MTAYRKRAYWELLAVTGIWGVATIVIKITLNGFNPLTFLIYRFFLSFLIGIPAIKYFTKIAAKDKKIAIGIILYSIFSTTIALGFLFLGLDKTTVLNQSLITLAAPLIAEYAGVIFLKEHITKKEKIGSLIAFLGITLTVLEPILNIRNQGFGELSGNLLIALYLASDTASLIIIKKLLRKQVHPNELTNISFVIGFITLLPFALFVEGKTILADILNTPIRYHFGVWYMAFLSGTLAYVLRAKAQKSIEVSEAALFGYLTSIASMPLAVIILGEKFSIPYLIGAIIVIAGVYIAEKRSDHTKKKKK